MAESQSRNGKKLTAGEVARVALAHIEDLTGKETAGVTAVQPDDDGWQVQVEIIEERRVSSTADILSLFEAALDPGGELRSYQRLRRYARGKGDGS